MEVGVTVSPALLLENEIFTLIATCCYAISITFKLYFHKCYIVNVKYVSIELYLVVFILFTLAKKLVKATCQGKLAGVKFPYNRLDLGYHAVHCYDCYGPYRRLLIVNLLDALL